MKLPWVLLMLTAMVSSQSLDEKLEKVTELVMGNPDKCGNIDPDQVELIPSEDCNDIKCSLPQDICQYSFEDDAFSCYEVTPQCKEFIEKELKESLGEAITTKSTSGTTKKPTTKLPTTTKPSARTSATTRKLRTTTELPADRTTKWSKVTSTIAPKSDKSATTPAKKATQPSGAKDDGNAKDYHSLCCYWATKQECDKNAEFMRPVCQKSCGTNNCEFGKTSLCKVKTNVKQCAATGSGSSSTSGSRSNNQRPRTSVSRRTRLFLNRRVNNNTRRKGNGRRMNLLLKKYRAIVLADKKNRKASIRRHQFLLRSHRSRNKNNSRARQASIRRHQALLQRHRSLKTSSRLKSFSPGRRGVGRVVKRKRTFKEIISRLQAVLDRRLKQRQLRSNKHIRRHQGIVSRRRSRFNRRRL